MKTSICIASILLILPLLKQQPKSSTQSKDKSVVVSNSSVTTNDWFDKLPDAPKSDYQTVALRAFYIDRQQERQLRARMAWAEAELEWQRIQTERALRAQRTALVFP